MFSISGTIMTESLKLHRAVAELSVQPLKRQKKTVSKWSHFVPLGWKKLSSSTVHTGEYSFTTYIHFYFHWKIWAPTSPNIHGLRRWQSGSNQIYLVTLRPRQLTQASSLQKNQTLQNVFLISLLVSDFQKISVSAPSIPEAPPWINLYYFVTFIIPLTNLMFSS